MRILLLAHAFNGLTQRLWVELEAGGHELSLELDINDAVTEEAVALWRPDLVIAPFLRRAIPETVWRHVLCLVVHPGPPGDRGPSALDWAVLDGAAEWGVTVLQATAVLDGGPVWAARRFPTRPGPKSSLYRTEVTEAAVAAVREAVARVDAGGFSPEPGGGTWRPLMTQADRAIDWSRDGTADILRKVWASDGTPGVRDRVAGVEGYLYDAHPEPGRSGRPGSVLARHEGAVCLGTTDGAVWIGQIRPLADGGERSFKRPATLALGEAVAGVAEHPPSAWCDIAFEMRGAVGVLHFPFYNGAFGAGHCRRLERAWREACRTNARVLVLMGGPEFWSNGIHLGTIEAADSPADESLATIEAMDALCQAILETDDKATIAAVGGNAAAGGVFLALCADRVVVRDGVVLNPHYKNMGNLYGSEFWTTRLPARVGADGVAAVMGHRLPLAARRAADMGLVDACLPGPGPAFAAAVEAMAGAVAADSIGFEALLAAKRAARAAVSLPQVRAAELERMRMNFYGFDPSYHVARYNFIRKVPHSRTPLYLARHRRGAGG